jgi:hypothetical protein
MKVEPFVLLLRMQVRVVRAAIEMGSVLGVMVTGVIMRLIFGNEQRGKDKEESSGAIHFCEKETTA